MFDQGKFKAGGSVRGERGQALLMAIIFLLALTVLGFGLIMVSSLDTQSSRNLRLGEEALNTAEEGALAGMAYVSDPTKGFATMSIGSGMTLDSITNSGRADKDPSQYQVHILMLGAAPVKEGDSAGKVGSVTPITYVLVRVRSRGMVSEKVGETFSVSTNHEFTNPPLIQRTVEIMARLRVEG